MAHYSLRKQRMIGTRFVCALSALLLASIAHAQTRYSFTDLTPDSYYSNLNGINAGGAVTGFDIGGGFLYDATGKHYMGSLTPGGASQPYSLSNTGYVTGVADTPGPSAHAYLYHNGALQDLGALAGDYSVGNSVNNKGVVTGGATDANGTFHAVYWDSAGLHDLGTFGGTYAGGVTINNKNQMLIVNSNGYLIYDSTGTHPIGSLGGGGTLVYGFNDQGQAAGLSTNVNGDTHAFLYNQTGLHDVGTLSGGTHSYGYGLGNDGVVIGDADNAAGIDHAFLYNAQGIHDLGSPGLDSHAFGINASDDVVGYYSLANGDLRAFLYDGSGIYNLNDLVPGLDFANYTLNFAAGISDNGDIVGTATTASGDQHIFLLTPLTPAAVPEPSLLALSGAFALSGAAFLRRRKKSAEAGRLLNDYD